MPAHHDQRESATRHTRQGIPFTAPPVRHVKMSEFYAKFASYIAEAEIAPVCVWRYKSPVVWLVSHATWARHPKIEQFLPVSHPLSNLRDPVNAKLQLAEDRLEAAMRTSRMRVPAGPLVRALLIRVLYSVPSDEALHEVIDYNLLYRWFVGFDLNHPLWPRDLMSETFALLLAQQDIVEMLAELVSLAASLANSTSTTSDFHIDLALLESWRARVGQMDSTSPDTSLIP